MSEFDLVYENYNQHVNDAVAKRLPGEFYLYDLGGSDPYDPQVQWPGGGGQCTYCDRLLAGKIVARRSRMHGTIGFHLDCLGELVELAQQSFYGSSIERFSHWMWAKEMEAIEAALNVEEAVRTLKEINA